MNSDEINVPGWSVAALLVEHQRRAQVAEARLRNVIGWRENDWPEWFDRRTAEAVAELASPSLETLERRIAEGSQKGSGNGG